MKQLLHKQLTLLAILLFAGVGNAFGAKFTVTMPYADAVQVSLSCGSYYITRSTNDEFEYNEGADVWLYVKQLKSQYEITAIKIDGVDQMASFESDSYQLYYHFPEEISGDHTVEVVFEQVASKTLTVTTIGGNGRVWFNDGIVDVQDDGNGAVIAQGRNVKMYVSANSGYKVQNVLIYNLDTDEQTNVTSSILNNDYYEFTALDADYTITVRYEEATTYNIHVNYDADQGNVHLITYSNDPDNGDWYWADPDNGNLISEGSNVMLQATVHDGAYEVASLVVDGTDVTDEYRANENYVLSNVQANHTITVTFGLKPTITLNFDEEKGGVGITNYGSVSSAQEYKYLSGSTVRIGAYPQYGYLFGAITVDGTAVTASYDTENEYYYYELENLSGNHTVGVTFSELPSVTCNYNEEVGFVYINDEYIPSGGKALLELDETVNIIAYPAEGYRIKTITVDGTDVTSSYDGMEGYSFTLAASSVVAVEFEEVPTYTITVDCDEDYGYVGFNLWYPDEVPTFYEGDDVRMSVFLYGEYLPTVTVDGTEVQLLNNNGTFFYTFENLQANHEVSVTFAEATYSEVTLAYNRSQGNVYIGDGQYNPGDVSFVTGSTVRLTVKPNFGYELESIYIDNDDITSSYLEDGYYDLVVSECTVTVSMKKKTASGPVALTLDKETVTFCSEYDLDFANVSGIKAYVASGYNPTTNELLLTRVTEVPAGTGLLIKGAVGNYQIPSVETYYRYANMLKGVAEDTYLSASQWETAWSGYDEYANYLLGDDDQFYQIADEGEEIPAYQAYLMIPTSMIGDNSAGAKLSLLYFDGDEENNGIATGLGFIMAGEARHAVTSTDDIYNLQGQKVSEKSLKPGIYIKNGKKFMVK